MPLPKASPRAFHPPRATVPKHWHRIQGSRAVVAPSGCQLPRVSKHGVAIPNIGTCVQYVPTGGGTMGRSPWEVFSWEVTAAGMGSDVAVASQQLTVPEEEPVAPREEVATLPAQPAHVQLEGYLGRKHDLEAATKRASNR